jgi:hypothetical protein
MTPRLPANSSLPTGALVSRTLGGVFDEAFDLYKRHFMTIALIVAVIFIPTQIALHGVSDTYLSPLEKRFEGSGELQPRDFGAAFALLFAYFFVGAPEGGLPGVLSFVALILVSAPVTFAVGEILAGRQTTIRQAYRQTAPLMLRLLGSYMVIALALVAVATMVIWFVSIAFAVVLPSSMAVLPEATIILIVLGIFLLPYLACRALMAGCFTFITPLMTLEGLGFGAAVARNTRLVQRRRYFRVWGATTFLPLVILGLRLLILLSVYSALEALRLTPLVAFVLQTTLASIIYFFFEPYGMIVITLLYYDCRFGRDGYDVHVLAENLLTSPSEAGERTAET